MFTSQKLVQQFHKEVADAPTSPAAPKFRNPQLRAKLILEETIETLVALIGSQEAIFLLTDELAKLQAKHETKHTAPNLIDTLDGLCDLQFVVEGT